MEVNSLFNVGLVGSVNHVKFIGFVLCVAVGGKFGLADVESLGHESGPRDLVLLGQFRRLVRLAESTRPIPSDGAAPFKPVTTVNIFKS